MFGAQLRCAVCSKYKPDRCTCSKLDLEDLIRQEAGAQGWTRRFDTSCLAFKKIETAAGGREAFIYLTKGDEYHRTLFADYVSEGGNILEPHSLLIAHGTEDAAVRAMVGKAILEFDRVIDTSYARRLFLSRGGA